MSYFIYIVLSFLPSLIWLSFYLKKDLHPEPKAMLIKVFLYGMLAGPLAAIIQVTSAATIYGLANSIPISQFISQFSFKILSTAVSTVTVIAIIAPITEELFKYLMVKAAIFKNQNLDEPVDIMIYFICAALGFAATENLLYFGNLLNAEAALIAGSVILRFIGATFLHALASGTFGYFVALSFLRDGKRRFDFFLKGYLLAIFFHATYNYLVYLTSVSQWNFLFAMLLVLFLTFLGILVSWQFQELRKKISICKM